MNNIREQLVDKIDRFLEVNGLSASEFGRMALNDSGFVKRLRDGKDVRLKTVDKIEAFIRNSSSKSQR